MIAVITLGGALALLGNRRSLRWEKLLRGLPERRQEKMKSRRAEECLTLKAASAAPFLGECGDRAVSLPAATSSKALVIG